MGTEIDSHSVNPNYGFESAKPYLKVGRNVVAFRTEIWGHGSFMFGRGTVSGTTVRFPALGYEGLKGLLGEASVAGYDLASWKVRAELGGERAGWAAPGFDDSGWAATTVPLTLEKGDVRWYRTSFATSQLPDPATAFAPVVAVLEGRRAKATIFLNGVIVGRWLSDTDWLQRGQWGRPLRDMWLASLPDHFPLPREMLHGDGRPNVLTVAFEDTSHSSEPPGEISSLTLQVAQEDLVLEGGNLVRKPALRSRKPLELVWR